MISYTLCLCAAAMFASLSFGVGPLALAGEPTGIGQKGTGQTKKSTERQQSGNNPDMSEVPEELQEGQTAQDMEQLTHEK